MEKAKQIEIYETPGERLEENKIKVPGENSRTEAEKIESIERAIQRNKEAIERMKKQNEKLTKKLKKIVKI